jgi:hypothetical protein
MARIEIIDSAVSDFVVLEHRHNKGGVPSFGA